MAIPLLTLTALQTELANMLGETGLQPNVQAPRAQFLQDSLEDAWKMYPWPFSMIDSTVAFVSGVAPLPSDFMPDGHFYIDDGFTDWGNIDYSDRIRSKIGGQNNTYYIRFNATTNLYEAVMVDSNGLPSTTITLNLRYQYNPLALADTTTAGVSSPTPYPSAQTLALGAMRFIIKADNQDADISQEISIFEAAVQGDYSAFNRIRMRNKRATGVAEARGHHTGGYA